MKKKETKKETKIVQRVRSDVYNQTGELLFNRIKLRLDALQMNYTDLADKLEITNSSLYRALKRGKLTIEMMERIAKIIEVPVSYFFEAETITRMVNEIIDYQRNPDLKSFMLGLTVEISKGNDLPFAVGMAIDKDAFWDKATKH